MKRSTCASGSGYVPSYSTGFCVASTRNGRASSCVCTSTVTRRSCMHSSRPDCVLGDARLTSSTSTTLVKIGPGRNSKRSSRWLKTLVPTTSAGSRSAVHCTRANSASIERAIARASAVLPTPGLSSISTWPSARRATTTSLTVCSGALTARPTFSRSRETSSATVSGFRWAVAIDPMVGKALEDVGADRDRPYLPARRRRLLLEGPHAYRRGRVRDLREEVDLVDHDVGQYVRRGAGRAAGDVRSAADRRLTGWAGCLGELAGLGVVGARGDD